MSQFIDIYHERIKRIPCEGCRVPPQWPGRRLWLLLRIGWTGRAGSVRWATGRLISVQIFSKFDQIRLRMAGPCSNGNVPYKHPEQGAAEGAPFIARHMIRRAEGAFDDFAGTGADDEGLIRAGAWARTDDRLRWDDKNETGRSAWKPMDYNRRSIFWICVLALFIGGDFDSRSATGASGAIKDSAARSQLIRCKHSGEMIGAVLGIFLPRFRAQPARDQSAARYHRSQSAIILLAASVCFPRQGRLLMHLRAAGRRCAGAVYGHAQHVAMIVMRHAAGEQPKHRSTR